MGLCLGCMLLHLRMFRRQTLRSIRVQRRDCHASGSRKWDLFERVYIPEGPP